MRTQIIRYNNLNKWKQVNIRWSNASGYIHSNILLSGNTHCNPHTNRLSLNFIRLSQSAVFTSAHSVSQIPEDLRNRSGDNRRGMISLTVCATQKIYMLWAELSIGCVSLKLMIHFGESTATMSLAYLTWCVQQFCGRTTCSTCCPWLMENSIHPELKQYRFVYSFPQLNVVLQDKRLNQSEYEDRTSVWRNHNHQHSTAQLEFRAQNILKCLKQLTLLNLVNIIIVLHFHFEGY